MKLIQSNMCSALLLTSTIICTSIHSQKKTTVCNGLSLNLNLKPAQRSKIASSIAKSQRRAAERSTQPRERCTHCHRPLVQCLCDALPSQKIDTHTQVLILQHPSEFRRGTISTVPLLNLILSNVEVVVGRNFDLNTRVVAEAIERNWTMVILYPGEDAIDLDDPTDEERDLLGMQHIAADDRKTLLIAVDGTWSQARRMFDSSPELVSKCHQIQFTSNATTVYDRIRTEPDDYCLSTSEAVAEALIRLEPKSTRRVKDYIHAALEKLVHVQLSFESQADPRFTRKKLKAMNKQQQRLELEQSLFNHSIFDLGYGAILRPLTLQDVGYVSLVNEDRSVHEIADMIQYHPNYCLGIECNNKLVACILRYRSGEIGMLYVDIDHRRRGYASILIQECMRRLRNFEDADCAETYIMDGNDASQATFSALGWKQEDGNQKKGTGKRRAKRKWVYDVERVHNSA